MKTTLKFLVWSFQYCFYNTLDFLRKNSWRFIRYATIYQDDRPDAYISIWDEKTGEYIDTIDVPKEWVSFEEFPYHDGCRVIIYADGKWEGVSSRLFIFSHDPILRLSPLRRIKDEADNVKDQREYWVYLRELLKDF